MLLLITLLFAIVILVAVLRLAWKAGLILGIIATIGTLFLIKVIWSVVCTMFVAASIC